MVRRTALLLAIAFVTAAGLFARVATRANSPAAPGAAPAEPSAEPPGAALYATYCGGCHAVERLRPGIAGADPARRGELETFLQRHGRASDADDRLILDYLAGDGGR